MPITAELDPDGRRIVIEAEWRWKELCKSLPGSKWDQDDRVWRIPLSWTSCLALRSTFRDDLVIGPGLTAWATNEIATRITPANDLRMAEDAPGAEELFPYQRAGVAFLATSRRALLADEPGLGKTAQAIRALKELRDQGEDVFPCLVVCPNTIKKNWAREFEMWLPGTRTTVVKGTATKRRKQIEDPDTDVLILNWESVRSHSRLAPFGSIALARCPECGGMDERITPGRCEVHEGELNRINFKSVIADECFTGGVLIDTPDGPRRIDELRVGDPVWGYDHTTKTVIRIKILDTMVRNSSTVLPGWNSTPNHPFYVVGDGYRPVGDLQEEDVLYALDRKNVCGVRPDVCRVRVRDTAENVLLKSMLGPSERSSFLVTSEEAREDDAASSRMRLVREGVPAAIRENAIPILHKELCPALAGSTAGSQGAPISHYDEAPTGSRQPAASGSRGTGAVREESVQADYARGSFSQREARLATSSVWNEHQSQTDIAGSSSSLATTSSTRVGVPSPVSAVDQTDMRVSRHSVPEEDAGSRSGRRSSSIPRAQECRCTTDGVAHRARMDSHPVLELRSDEQYERMCREGAQNLGNELVQVYSITTETGNYFANGVLVRNCHRSKDARSKQTRALWAATGDADIRFAMTGTPIANNVTDMWSILHWLSPEDWPAKTKWMDRFVDTMMNAFGGMVVLGVKPNMKDEFYKGINPRMRRMLKARVLPWLPEIVRERRDTEMSTKQQKAYVQMRDNMIAELENGDALSAPSILTQTLRLLQFASSYAEIVVDETTGEPKAILSEPSCKVDQLMDDIKNGDFGDDSVAVCAVSRQLIDLLSAAMTKAKIPHGLITGTVSEDDRQRAVDDFQSGKIKWILFTAQAGGVGITLTAARRMIMIQRPWSLVDYKQAQDRVHRIGSEIHDSIIITDYVTEGSIEERVINVLGTKADNFEEIVRDKEQLLTILKDDKEGRP